MEVENLLPAHALQQQLKGEHMQEDGQLVLDRSTATYINQDEPFRVTQQTYQRQYAQLYFVRLQCMAAALRAAAAKHWPGLEMVKILDVGAREEGRPCCVLGTVYKDMKLKPSILDEYTKDRGLKAALDATSFCSEDDSVALEDEGGRMLLKGSPDVLPVQQLVTGVVVVIRGQNSVGGADFEVQEVLYPGMAPQPPLPAVNEDKYCALISGIKLNSNQSDLLQLHMALDMLSGYVGGDQQQQLASKVVRLVIAGGCIGGLDQLAVGPQQNTYGKQPQMELQPVRDLDMYLSEAGAALPVDVMPGSDDPSNVALPQQPLHRCLLPGCGRSSAVVRATNPHSFQLGGVHFLGSSGQPVEDLAKYSTHADRPAVLEACLKWRHLAPTAPDTLAVYPFANDDPFIINTTPHVLFAGNQPDFETRMVTGPEGQQVRVVCVPNFSHTGCLVLVNLRTLDITPLCFKA